MNVGRYLRGEDRHVGTARTTQPQPPQRTESLIGCVNHDCDKCKERKPLTDKQIQKIWDVASGAIPGWSRHIAYARAIEAAHGIKGEA